jgi:hypothetical protein
MFPGVDGFAWDSGHVIFLGAFFAVITALFVTLTRVWLRSLRAKNPKVVQSIRWHEDFHELPPRARQCRHALTGEVRERTCPNEFDCRTCAEHPKFVRSAPVMAEQDLQDCVAGMVIPLDRLYHRGHTWVREEADGTASVGLDEFGRRLMGKPEQIDMPAAGEQLIVNGAAFHINGVRVLSPVEGEVVESAPLRLRVRLPDGFRTDHLLRGREVIAWMQKEIERLQLLLGPAAMGPALADGGALAVDFQRENPEADWDAVRGFMLLEP